MQRGRKLSEGEKENGDKKKKKKKTFTYGNSAKLSQPPKLSAVVNSWRLKETKMKI